MIHGPGCPVCVLPIGRVDSAIRAGAHARRDPVLLRRHAARAGSNRVSLLKAKAGGADVRMIYSSADALKIAQENPDKQVVFFAIGFETTTPPTAVAILQAAKAGPRQFHRVLQPRADPLGHRQHPRIARGAPAGPAAAGRLHRPGACLHRDRQPALRIFCRGIPAPGGDRRLRAARRDAGDPDAGAPVERRPRRGGERILPRRDARRQPQGAGHGGGSVRAAPHLRMARPRAGALQRPARSRRNTPLSMPSAASTCPTMPCPTTRPANAARSSAA